MDFSEINKASIRGKKKTPYIALYFTAFWNNCCLIISKKMRGCSQFSLRISGAFAKIYFFRSHKPRKNTLVLVGTVLKSKEKQEATDFKRCSQQRHRKTSAIRGILKTVLSPQGINKCMTDKENSSTTNF